MNSINIVWIIYACTFNFDIALYAGFTPYKKSCEIFSFLISNLCITYKKDNSKNKPWTTGEQCTSGPYPSSDSCTPLIIGHAFNSGLKIQMFLRHIFSSVHIHQSVC